MNLEKAPSCHHFIRMFSRFHFLPKGLGLLAALCLSGFSAAAQPTNPIVLWTNGAPGALGTADKDTPTLTPYWPKPELATGAAMLICPGGGYAGLAAHEGEGYARWFNDHGVAAFVLKYRLGSGGYHHPAMLQDVSRAMRHLRAHADEWKIDTHRIGVIGSSAGGHLASTLMTHFDAGQPLAADNKNPSEEERIESQSSRPDLGILCYPVITMTGEKTHGGSRKNLLGENPDPALLELLSSEKQVKTNTPPAFLFHTSDDKGVPVENSLMFAAALHEKHVLCDLHVYESGPHGMGLGFKPYDTYTPERLHPWTFECLRWLKSRNFVK